MSDDLGDAVPEDFPYQESLGCVTGAQPKMLLVEAQGRFRQGGSPQSDQRRRDWLSAEDIAQQMRGYCTRKLAEGAVPDECAALQRGLRGLRGKPWFDDAHNLWIMRRVANLLGWPPLAVELEPRRTYEIDITEEQAIAMGIVLVGPPRPHVHIPTAIEKMLQKISQRASSAG